MSKQAIHSEEYIGDHRYEWWNRDYVSLLLSRIDFNSVYTIADLGTGAGHWASALLMETKHEVSITCVDFEEHWLKEVRKTLSRTNIKHEVKTVLSDVHNLQIEDNQFDLTTCQTLLMHCKDPYLALSEMKRVTKTGGYIVAIEPTNILNRMQFFDAVTFLSPREQANLYYIWACYHRGLCKTTGARHDIAPLIPNIMQELGCKNIKAYQNDKVSLDYSSEESFLSMEKEYKKDDFMYFAIEGGASQEDIKNSQEIFMQLKGRCLENDGVSATPLNSYIFIGQKI